LTRGPADGLLSLNTETPFCYAKSSALAGLHDGS
jgi:hypothetical protein